MALRCAPLPLWHAQTKRGGDAAGGIQPHVQHVRACRAGLSFSGVEAQRYTLAHAGNFVELDQLAALGLALGAAAVPADTLLRIGCAVRRDAVSLSRAGLL